MNEFVRTEFWFFLYSCIGKTYNECMNVKNKLHPPMTKEQFKDLYGFCMVWPEIEAISRGLKTGISTEIDIERVKLKFLACIYWQLCEDFELMKQK